MTIVVDLQALKTVLRWALITIVTSLAAIYLGLWVGYQMKPVTECDEIVRHLDEDDATCKKKTTVFDI